MRNKWMLLVLVLILAVAGTGCGKSTAPEQGGASQETVTYRLAHEEVDGSMQDLYAKKFKELVEEKSEGRINIEVYPVGQLGDGPAQVELLQNGGIEFGINNPGSTATVVPENQLFSLHFMFADDMKVNQDILQQGKGIKKLNELYEAKNMKVLDWFTEGYNMWTANKPITSPADMEGVKIRTMASPMIVKAYSVYGANPTPVPYMEVYSSLQLKMIDAQINPLFAIQEMKFYEVQSNLMLSKQDIFFGTMTANSNFWSGLSDADKELFTSVIPAVNDYIFDVEADMNSKRLEMIKEDSEIEIIELTDDQRAEFKAASMGARDYYVDEVGEIGQELLTLFENDLTEFND